MASNFGDAEDQTVISKFVPDLDNFSKTVKTRKQNGMEPMELSFHEEDICVASSNPSDIKFDETIGHIEDIIMDEEFQKLQHDFMEKYYLEFEDTEENKFVYTDIHREYVQLIEKYLEEELTRRISDFTMGEFTRQIKERRNELEGEIFEMLLTFSDFLVFKEMFLDYRAEKEGRTVDLSDGITINALQDPDDDDQGGAGDGLSLGGCSFSLTGHSFSNMN